jgi:hypothetical protein
MVPPIGYAGTTSFNFTMSGFNDTKGGPLYY